MTVFDPRLHTAEQVADYLLGADDREIGRVLAAERRGLARPQILTAYPPSLGGRPQLPEGE